MKQTDLKLKPVKDQVIVITGASSGIGLMTAKLAAKAVSPNTQQKTNPFFKFQKRKARSEESIIARWQYPAFTQE